MGVGQGVPAGSAGGQVFGQREVEAWLGRTDFVPQLSDWKLCGHILLQARDVRIAGYQSEALTAAAHDHARIWWALRQQQPEGPGTAAQAASQDQVQAAVLGLQGELNFPPVKFSSDAALLALLSGATRQQLEEHLQPFRLQQWEAAAGSAGQQQRQAGVGSAAPLRRDNTTRFVGVARITGSVKLQAAITGARCCILPACAWPAHSHARPGSVFCADLPHPFCCRLTCSGRHPGAPGSV